MVKTITISFTDRTNSGNTFHKLDIGRSLLTFSEFDFTFFWEQAIEAGKAAKRTGQLPKSTVDNAKTIISKCHPYVTAGINSDYNDVVLDCIIEYICRSERMTEDELWTRCISSKIPYEAAIFKRISEYKTFKGTNQWVNIAGLQKYAKEKIAFIYGTDAPDEHNNSMRCHTLKQYFDLAFSIAANECAIPKKALPTVRVYNPCLAPTAAFAVNSSVAKSMYRRMEDALEKVPDRSVYDKYNTDVLEDRFAIESYAYAKGITRPQEPEEELFRSAMEGLPDRMYVVSSLKAILDLEFDVMSESGIHLKKCETCGRYFLINATGFGERFCDRINSSGKTCKQNYDELCAQIMSTRRQQVGQVGPAAMPPLYTAPQGQFEPAADFYGNPPPAAAYGSSTGAAYYGNTSPAAAGYGSYTGGSGYASATGAAGSEIAADKGAAANVVPKVGRYYTEAEVASFNDNKNTHVESGAEIAVGMNAPDEPGKVDKTEYFPDLGETVHIKYSAPKREYPPTEIPDTAERRGQRLYNSIYKRVGKSVSEHEFREWSQYLSNMKRNVKTGEGSLDQLYQFLDYSDKLSDEIKRAARQKRTISSEPVARLTRFAKLTDNMHSIGDIPFPEYAGSSPVDDVPGGVSANVSAGVSDSDYRTYFRDDGFDASSAMYKPGENAPRAILPTATGNIGGYDRTGNIGGYNRTGNVAAQSGIETDDAEDEIQPAELIRADDVAPGEVRAFNPGSFDSFGDSAKAGSAGSFRSRFNAEAARLQNAGSSAAPAGVPASAVPANTVPANAVPVNTVPANAARGRPQYAAADTVYTPNTPGGNVKVKDLEPVEIDGRKATIGNPVWERVSRPDSDGGEG